MDSNISNAQQATNGFSLQKIVDKVIKFATHTDAGLVLLVFLLAFIVRAQLMRYELFFEFDSYWHARMVSYILQGLGAPTVDPLGYYQNIAAATFGSGPHFFWYASAVMYKIFTLNSAYNFELWVLFVKILPALYGAITCVAMYFLGKELFRGSAHEKAAGFLAGIFAAIVPSFVYRTMGGFFEDDSFGFIWMILGFYFLIRALRSPAWAKENIIHALLAGAGFGLMVISWSGYNQLVPVLLGTGFIGFLLYIRDNELTHAKNHALLWMVTFLVFAAVAFAVTGTGWLSQIGTILGGVLFRAELQWFHVGAVILVLFALCGILFKVRKNIQPEHEVWLRRGVNAIIIILVLAPLIVNIFNVSLRTGDVLGQTVGEESEGKNYFGNKYSFMVLFAFIGIPLCGYLLLKRAKDYAVLTLPLVWIVVVFFMAWGKLKFTYYWGLPLAMMSGIVSVFALKWMAKHTKRTQKITAILVGFFLITGIAAGTLFVTQNVPNIESSAGWKEALFWSNQNLSENTKFFNWWDEGHWISFLSGKKVLIDNRNADTKATSSVAQFVLSTDLNNAQQLVKQYGSTHLIFGDDLLSKLPNLGFYAYNTTSIDDPRIKDIFGVMMGCSLNTSPITKEQTHTCGSNQFSVEQFNAYPTVWTDVPNTNQNGTALFIYRSEDKSRMFVFTAAANKTTLVKLWFGEAEMKNGFTEVYRNRDGVRIYEVK